MESEVNKLAKEEGKHIQETPKKETEAKHMQGETKMENETKQENQEDTMELKKQIESLKIQNQETEDRLKRIAAEFDNYKKRSSKEKESLYASLLGDIVSNLLPVIDNLEKAVGSKTEDESYKQGVELVLKQFKDVLEANGVKEIEAVGKTFDPELHEAVSLVTDDSLGEKEVKEEYRKGYMIGNKVIRHSMVVVAN